MVKRFYWECSVCGERLQTTIARNGMDAVYLGSDGKPHHHKGTKWEPTTQEENVPLT